MNDYKGLIDSLRICVKYNKAVDALCNAEFAADAIEQLVKERDGWMIAYDGAQRAYHEWFAEAQKLMKERDALLADGKIDGDCQTCANNISVEACRNSIREHGDDCWEWRGVQK